MALQELKPIDKQISRREFLKDAGLVAGSVVLANILSSSVQASCSGLQNEEAN